MARMLALLLAVGAGIAQAVLRQRSMTMADGFVQALQFRHQLRVCNAFPFSAPLDVFSSKEKLTHEPMPYKTCQDFHPPLKAGDKLEFQFGDASAGSFSVSELPNNDAVLLLVIHRHDQQSTAVSFESHVFSNLANAQLAVIDTYRGAAKSTTRIMDQTRRKDVNAQPRSEELRFSSVVAVNPGKYEVELAGDDGKVKAKTQLIALNQESYIVLRTGVEAKAGPSYPEELVVYPKSDPHSLPNGAAARGLLAALLTVFFSSYVAVVS